MEERDPAWAGFAQEVRDGLQAYKAAQAKDQEKMIELSEAVSNSCEHCRPQVSPGNGEPLQVGRQKVVAPESEEMTNATESALRKSEMIWVPRDRRKSFHFAAVVSALRLHVALRGKTCA